MTVFVAARMLVYITYKTHLSIGKQLSFSLKDRCNNETALRAL